MRCIEFVATNKYCSVFCFASAGDALDIETLAFPESVRLNEVFRYSRINRYESVIRQISFEVIQQRSRNSSISESRRNEHLQHAPLGMSCFEQQMTRVRKCLVVAFDGNYKLLFVSKVLKHA
ncbi:hypothetical protein CI15_21500 [Paraburkholderia monticola]|uniref:Uncharacterized protein n=1 Tax=Paraburkholderia monticola TaxID=1399968 RepID=A0A149PII5_9BURK|nr:hypothetical protein CI15_21500 [Paraburkholderia monticola]